jgi:hypothetical protein
MQKVQSSITFIIPDHFLEVIAITMIGSFHSLQVVAHKHDRLESLID